MFSILKSMGADALETISLNFASITCNQINSFIQGDNQNITENVIKNLSSGNLFDNLDICDIVTNTIKGELHNYNRIVANTYAGPSVKIARYGLNFATDCIIDTVLENTRSYFF